MNLVNFLNNHQSHLIRKPYIIAEVGVNHKGSINLAKRLIDEAAEGGAKAIKFQSYRTNTIASKDSPYYWDITNEPLCQIISSYMAERGSGSIINFPSTFSVVAPYQNLYKGTKMGCPAAYSASKGGIDALSHYLSSYWAAKGVRVNIITPHGVWNNDEEAFEKNYANFSPMQRMSCNHELAPALIYLLSDAASYITGNNMLAEDGWTA